MTCIEKVVARHLYGVEYELNKFTQNEMLTYAGLGKQR